jgi:glycosyltransferase involved in cell wall biosynthesis
MAAGLPVVARYLPVYQEFFENEVNGFLVEEPFVEELSTATEDLLEADRHRTEIGARNREAAAAYGWEHAVGDMESIIIEIASSPKTSEQGVTAKPYD